MYKTKETAKAFHTELRTPAVPRMAKLPDKDRILLATDVIPWLCWAEEIKGGRKEDMVIDARHWGILRPLGLPTVPATHPLHARDYFKGIPIGL